MKNNSLYFQNPKNIKRIKIYVNMPKREAHQKSFRTGDILRSKSGTFSIVTESSKKGNSYVKVRPIQGNPLRVSQNAAINEVNKALVRRASHRQLEKHQSRFSF